MHMGRDRCREQSKGCHILCQICTCVTTAVSNEEEVGENKCS